MASNHSQSMIYHLEGRVMPKLSGRVYELDSLRGLAAVSVMLFHYTTRFDQLYVHSASIPFGAPWGQYGVYLFFVISGFVITMSVVHISGPGEFIIKRSARLLPSYWTAIWFTFFFIKVFTLPGRETSVFVAITNMSMLQLMLGVPSVDGVYWSLTIEFFFYFWMLIAIVLKKIQYLEQIGVFWIVFAVVVSVIARLMGVHIPTRLDMAFLLTYCPLFVAGIVFYNMNASGMCRKRHLIIAICFASQAVLDDVFALAAMALCIGLFYALVTGRLRWLDNPILVFLGTISYSLYLIHQNIGYILMRSFYIYSSSPLVVISSTVVIALGLASVVAFLVEKPLMKWSRKYINRMTETRNMALSNEV